jgi:hypothetical protein
VGTPVLRISCLAKPSTPEPRSGFSRTENAQVLLLKLVDQARGQRVIWADDG